MHVMIIFIRAVIRLIRSTMVSYFFTKTYSLYSFCHNIALYLHTHKQTHQHKIKTLWKDNENQFYIIFCLFFIVVNFSLESILQFTGVA